MLPTKKRCPRCGRVLPAEAFNLVRGGRELAGWCRVCNHRYYLDRKEAGFVRKNPSGRRMLPSTRDMEPTLRTLDIVRESGTGAKAYVIVNNFYAYGTLDRQLVEYLEGEEVPIIAKIPRAVALSRAAAAGVSVAEYDPKSHVVAPIELLADSVLNEEEKNNG